MGRAPTHKKRKYWGVLACLCDLQSEYMIEPVSQVIDNAKRLVWLNRHMQVIVTLYF